MQICILISVILITRAKAQTNLVPNHSFEINDCPPNSIYDIIERAFPWFNPTVTTPDHIDTCGFNLLPPVVTPYEGSGVAAIVCYGSYPSFPDAKEYIGVKLKNQLKKDETYCIKFYVLKSFRYRVAIKEIGAFVTDSLISIQTNSTLNFIPQVVSNKMLKNEESWEEISGRYKAIGKENYLYIGCFIKNDSTTIEYTGPDLGWNNSAYYYIDNVWLYECEEDSIPTEPPPASDSSLHYKVPNVISPNGDGLNDAFVLESRGVKEVSVKVYNRWGEEVVSRKVSGISTDILNKTILWDATHKGQPAPQGVYYYLIELSTKAGEVIIEKGTVTIL